jgi:hypothetical protein
VRALPDTTTSTSTHTTTSTMAKDDKVASIAAKTQASEQDEPDEW